MTKTKVFLTSVYTYPQLSPGEWLKRRSNTDTSICVANAEEADIIIFAELHAGRDPYFRKIINHQLYRKYRHKCVLYHDADLSITPIPTISPSIEKWQYNPKHKRSFHYLARACENKVIDEAPVTYNTERMYLYSFIGSQTHAVRSSLLKVEHLLNTFIKDTSGLHAWELSPAVRKAYEIEYLQVMKNSYFILCPRGIGPCSYRLFEAMQMGRVPVIISDAWVHIPNIAWNQFSITIAESKIHLLPQILNERKGQAVQMGKLARKYWEDCFSPEVSLSLLAEAASTLLKHNYTMKDAFEDYLQFFRSRWHAINFLRSKKNA